MELQKPILDSVLFVSWELLKDKSHLTYMNPMFGETTFVLAYPSGVSCVTLVRLAGVPVFRKKTECVVSWEDRK